MSQPIAFDLLSPSICPRQHQVNGSFNVMIDMSTLDVRGQRILCSRSTVCACINDVNVISCSAGRVSCGSALN